MHAHLEYFLVYYIDNKYEPNIRNISYAQHNNIRISIAVNAVNL